MPNRVHREPLPKGREAYLRRLSYVSRQPGVIEVNINSNGLEVTREMEDTEGPVITEGTDGVDGEFLLGNLALTTLTFDAEEHGTAALFRAGVDLEKRGLEAKWLLAASWRLLSAWLGVRGPMPAQVYGYTVIVQPAEVMSDRIILVGGAQPMFLSEATHGVVLDMGV